MQDFTSYLCCFAACERFVRRGLFEPKEAEIDFLWLGMHHLLKTPVVRFQTAERLFKLWWDHSKHVAVFCGYQFDKNNEMEKPEGIYSYVFSSLWNQKA